MPSELTLERGECSVFKGNGNKFVNGSGCLNRWNPRRRAGSALYDAGPGLRPGYDLFFF
jgi:hypothetical protein